jgi:hypothetical protein
MMPLSSSIIRRTTAGILAVAALLATAAVAAAQAPRAWAGSDDPAREPLRVAAWPTPFNPFRWVGYVSTEEAWTLHDVRLGLPFDPEAGKAYYKPTDAARINAAKRTPEAMGFLRFSQYPVWRMVPVTAPEGGVAVEGVDVRFGTPEEGRFQVRVVLDQNLQVVSSKFAYGMLKR